MTRTILGLLLAICGVAAIGAQAPDRDALRDRLQARFDVVPITGGVALTPKTRRGDIRLIEVSDAIAINGAFVTGSELRQRLGSDADEILQLSYLDPEARRSMFPKPGPAPQTPAPRADRDEIRKRRGGSNGDRVRVFGDVRVPEGDEVNGQVVAVFGSARVDGVVRDQVVSVFGTITLGPRALVHGDVVSVGGVVNRAAGSEVRGAVTEVAVGRGLRHDALPWVSGVGLLGDGFVGFPRLVASSFRLLTLMILATLAYLIARRSVENAADRIRENPAKASFVGITSVLLMGPLLFMVTIVLILTVIGIPLLLLVPVLLLFLAFMAMAGFTGAAYAIGQWVSRRFGVGPGAGLGTVLVGVVVILIPVMVARVVGLGGWATTPIALPLAALAFLFEVGVWSAGFGAVLSNTLAGWQSRRAARAVPPVAAG